MDEAHAQDHAAPCDDEEGEPPASAQTTDHHVAGQFEEAVAGEEDEQGDGVARADVQTQVIGQTGDVRRGDVRAVEEGEAEDEAEHGEDAEVDLPSVTGSVFLRVVFAGWWVLG